MSDTTPSPATAGGVLRALLATDEIAFGRANLDAREAIRTVEAMAEAAGDCLDTELGDMACVGSYAPAEHALGKLAVAYAAYRGDAAFGSAAPAGDGVKAPQRCRGCEDMGPVCPRVGSPCNHRKLPVAPDEGGFGPITDADLDAAREPIHTKPAAPAGGGGEAVAEKLEWALDYGGTLADWCNLARPALTALMAAYERRVRSECKTDADLAAEPWRCAEFVQAEEALRASPVLVVEVADRRLASTGSAQHPDDEAVDRFAAAMKAKLADARAKGRSGWNDPADCPQQFLSDALRKHVEKGDPRDVANFCMFLHQRGEGILPAGSAPAPSAWRPMHEAPKNGTGILALLPESNFPVGIRFQDGGWHVAWDDSLLGEFDQPEWWMFCPDMPGDAAAPTQEQQG